jgi:hypothetical protein
VVMWTCTVEAREVEGSPTNIESSMKVQVRVYGT